MSEYPNDHQTTQRWYHDHEQWSFLDLAPIVHPMHIHLADFQLLGRDAHDVSGFDPAAGGTRAPIRHDAGTAIPLAPNEQGYKDVFRVPGGQPLRVMGLRRGARRRPRRAHGLSRP
ncbi:multicopper oxidase domain-containing protein [Streptomyces sp. WP-1]|uniref:multicopper oxidase domain-containing protein n=1 Tax=Streptomyces sp. WP-1 TaxID=3041497 RepID=UPI00351BCF11